MKNFFLIIALSSLSILSKAQGNLQFNQVLTYSGNLTSLGSGGSGTTASSPTYTCPAGKVWKIESKTRAPKLVMYSYGLLKCYLNSILFTDLYTTDGSLGGSAHMIDNAPIWLKAGDNIYYEYINTGNGNYTTSYYLSIIEYNIVP
jgi:hypothetical protein